MSPNIYGRDLALVHHLGFGSYADACAPGILAVLEPVRRRAGLVVELGCGSGALTRHLVGAGHRVLATDASPAMVQLTRSHAPGVDGVRALVLPDEPMPEADAVVSVGHVLNYLPAEPAIDRALAAVGTAVRPGGVLALDLCDMRFADGRDAAPPYARVEDEWAIVTRYEVPAPGRFVRHITTFVRETTGSWRRDDERHVNVLVDTARSPQLLARQGIVSTVRPSFGEERLPDGLVAVVGTKPS